MRTSVELDHLLENAVATALGLEKPHPQPVRKVRNGHAKATRRSLTIAHKLRREHIKVAA